MVTKQHFNRLVSIAPLVTYRILFGIMMFLSIVRFSANGWIADMYIKPVFFFTYMGFDWVRPMTPVMMYGVFMLMAISALCIALGLFYRISIIAFFLLFSYVELLDVTNYLNHYYFISVISFLMIWLPANRYFSLDVWRTSALKRTHVPLWMVGVLRMQLAFVYIFAGLAKLNPDWMLKALPMKIWLPAKSHLPIIGNLMYEDWVAYLFSWFGATYDLFIVVFLLNKKKRPVAYLFVLIFHVATAIFFPGIGMFPYVMIVSSTLFFSASWHKRLLDKFSAPKDKREILVYNFSKSTRIPVAFVFTIYFLFQLLIPCRFLVYPGHLFWTEQGYRFSWRVMLMEKSGNAFFHVRDGETGKTFEVNNAEFLTPLQEKMMCTQPDMILRYAHFLANTYKDRGFIKPEVYAEDYVALNGNRSKLFINPKTNLASESLSWKSYTWVLPYAYKPGNDIK